MNSTAFFKVHRQDWTSSLILFVIALPLSLGIAVASGAPPATGIITAIVGGIVVGLLSGAPLVVSGPAAGLSALVFEAVQKYGLAKLGLIASLCGLIQLALGGLKLGKLITYIPRVVLEGVLSAIGLIICVQQLHILMGQNIPGSPVQAFLGLPSSFGATIEQARISPILVPPVLLCGLLTLFGRVAIPAAVKRVTPSPTLNMIPGALPAVIVGTMLSLFWEMPRVKLAAMLPTMSTELGYLLQGTWLQESLLPIALTALGFAVVASAETLITASAIDILAREKGTPQSTNLNRELIAQGFGNTVSGIVGGLPITGVMVRSAANMDAGAQTRWSTILHGTWMAIFVAFLPGTLERIPLSCLAAILIATGYKLIGFRKIANTLASHPLEGTLWVGTIAAIVFTNLLDGLVIALVASLIVYGTKKLLRVRSDA